MSLRRVLAREGGSLPRGSRGGVLDWGGEMGSYMLQGGGLGRVFLGWGCLEACLQSWHPHRLLMGGVEVFEKRALRFYF